MQCDDRCKRRTCRAKTIAGSGQLAFEIDQLQYDLDEGPSLTCLRDGVVVRLPDLAGERRWPRFGKQALDRFDVHAMLFLPLQHEAHTSGVLNMYRSPARRYTDGELLATRVFANEVAVMVTAATRFAGQDELIGQLNQALTSRATIDHAIGIVMAQNRCSPEAAFAFLSTTSQNNNVKVRQIAAHIVESVHQLPSDRTQER
ncbi:MAG: ANTAR domain-containing protein [Streptosporangiales bacterium]|nr:ANTAR domain-containing protein [Streptosporangiales bacterium]